MKIGKSRYVEALDFGGLLIHHLMDSTALFWFRRAIFGAIYALITPKNRITFGIRVSIGVRT